MAADEMVTREEFRELRIAHYALETKLETKTNAMLIDLALLKDFMTETRARNRALPGWLLTATGIALPLIGSLATMWLAGRLP